jgi:hypothetical protein
MHAKSTRPRAQERLNRLPRIAQALVADQAAARQFLAAAPLGRMAIAAGISPSPGLGVAEFDAMISLIRDAIGDARLSDAEFEHALRLSIPPECREVAQ